MKGCWWKPTIGLSRTPEPDLLEKIVDVPSISGEKNDMSGKY